MFKVLFVQMYANVVFAISLFLPSPKEQTTVLTQKTQNNSTFRHKTPFFKNTHKTEAN